MGSRMSTVKQPMKRSGAWATYAAALDSPKPDGQPIITQRLDFPLNALLRPFSDGKHGNDRRDADDYSEYGKPCTHFVVTQADERFVDHRNRTHDTLLLDPSAHPFPPSSETTRPSLKTMCRDA